MQCDLRIKNGSVVTEDGVKMADVIVCKGKIAAVTSGCRDRDGIGAGTVIDAAGKYVLPGFIDPHVHLNEPGLTNSEDFYTGTCGAAAGGTTTVLEHPLTFPLPDNLEAFEQKKKLGQSKAVTNFGLFGACSPENDGEIERMIKAGAVAFKTFLTYSDEIPMLTDGRLLEKMKLLARHGALLVVHCENNDIVDHYTKKQQSEGRIGCSDYPGGRPQIAELEAVRRICLCAEKTGCKVNIAHCSLPEAVGTVVEARKAGANVSVETCPQYLALDETMLESLGVYGICNPPLRSPENVRGLWDCLMQGRIDFVCSDHATYTREEKLAGRGNAFLTPAGVTGIETVFQILFSEGVGKRNMGPEQFALLSSTNAAKRFNLYPRKGRIGVGADADLVILDPGAEWVVDEEALKQKIKWSPYHQMRIKGRVETTIIAGRVIYDKGVILTEPGSGTFLEAQR